MSYIRSATSIGPNPSSFAVLCYTKLSMPYYRAWARAVRL